MQKFTTEQLEVWSKDKSLPSKERIRFQKLLDKRRRKDKVNAYSRKWKTLNKDKTKKQKENYRTSGKAQECWKRWAVKNKHKIREKKRRRKGLEAKALKESKTADLILAWEMGWRGNLIICPYCLKNTPPEKIHIEHFFCLSKGGPHEINNLSVACASCNESKSDKDPFEFIKDRVFQGFQETSPNMG